MQQEDRQTEGAACRKGHGCKAREGPCSDCPASAVKTRELLSTASKETLRELLPPPSQGLVEGLACECALKERNHPVQDLENASQSEATLMFKSVALL